MKHYYAARHVLSRNFTYESGWTVFEFESEKDADDWVYETNSQDSRNGYNQRSERITREIARNITGSRTKRCEPVINNSGLIVGYMLEKDLSYYNPYYWG
jgi:hypothetical protein